MFSLSDQREFVSIYALFPTGCATRCTFQSKCLWTILRCTHSFCVETGLLHRHQQASDVTRVTYEAARHYTVWLLSSRCASRGNFWGAPGVRKMPSPPI